MTNATIHDRSSAAPGAASTDGLDAIASIDVEGQCVIAVRGGRVVASTAAAAALVRESSLLSIDDGRIVIADPAGQDWFNAVCGRRSSLATCAVANQAILSDGLECLVVTVFGAHRPTGGRDRTVHAHVLLHRHVAGSGRIPCFGSATDTSSDGWLGKWFTPAECRVVQLLLEGFDTAEIADRLRISRGGVRFHVKNLLSKTGARRQTQLVAELGRRLWQAPAPLSGFPRVTLSSELPGRLAGGREAQWPTSKTGPSTMPTRT